MKKYVTGPWPHLAKRAAREIEPGDIRDILAKMIGDGVTTYCNRVRSSRTQPISTALARSSIRAATVALG